MYNNTLGNLPSIGEGVSYSEMFNSVSGGTNTTKGLELINQSIKMILTTPIGTRFFLPEYGSKLDTLVFEQNNFILHDLINIYVREALGTWEKRIVVTEVRVMVSDTKNYSDIKDNVLPVEVLYRLANSNVSGSYVYPFTREIYDIGQGGEIYGV